MKLQPTPPESEYLLDHLGINSSVAAAYLEHQLPGGVEEAINTRHNKAYRTEFYEALGHIAQQGNGDMYLLADVVRQVRDDRAEARRPQLEAMGYSVWQLPEPREEREARERAMRVVSRRILLGFGRAAK